MVEAKIKAKAKFSRTTWDLLKGYIYSKYNRNSPKDLIRRIISDLYFKRTFAGSL